MAYENIRVAHKNFCLGPQAGTYCSVDTSGVAAVMRVKNGSGDLIRTYDFYPSASLNVDSQASIYPYRKVESLKYVGPTGQSGFYTGMPFYTLERQINDIGNTSNSCIIKMWELNYAQARLELKRTYQKISNADDIFDCSAMVIETLETTFMTSASTHTGSININNTSSLKKYDLLMLGPSRDITNLNAIEFCYVHSISGTNVSIRTYDPTWPTTYEYLEDDPITVIRHAYLFSSGYDAALYKLGLDEYNVGAVLHKEVNNIFDNVTAADWNDYFSGISFVKERSMLTISTDDYEVFRSHNLKNLESNKKDNYPVYDLAFNGTSIYRLQDRITRWDDTGVISVTNWTSYNFVEDTVLPYSASVVIYVYPSGYIFRQQSCNIYAKVKDQYGVALSNKNIQFYQLGDPGAYFTPSNGQGVTNIDGEVIIQYRAGSNYTGSIKFSVRADGASTHLGSQYIWDILYGQSLASFSGVGQVVKQISAISPGTLTLNQVSRPWLRQLDQYGQPTNNSIVLRCFSKFSFPGGHWEVGGPDDIIFDFLIEQAKIPLQNPLDVNNNTVPSNIGVDQRLLLDGDGYVKQTSKRQDTLPVDQMYISRHYLYGNSDEVTINQYVFVQEARPVFWSEKNPVNTDIWLRLRPFATSLDPNTFNIKIREISYAGEEDWRDITLEGTVNVFDAGGGLFGIEFQWYPINFFHNNGIVHVKFYVYDTAPIPNKITTEYWFVLIADYKMPYLENIFPVREDTDVNIDTNISFDILDINTGVDINSLEMYVNYRQVYPTYSGIDGGYHVEHSSGDNFNYKDVVLVSIKVNDISDQANRLIDSWRFYCVESNAPWVDNDNMFPGRCKLGMDRKFGSVELQIYGDMNGVDGESIELFVGGPKRDAYIKPIVYRLN